MGIFLCICQSIPHRVCAVCIQCYVFNSCQSLSLSLSGDCFENVGASPATCSLAGESLALVREDQPQGEEASLLGVLARAWALACTCPSRSCRDLNHGQPSMGGSASTLV